jgi:hypothetical protein
MFEEINPLDTRNAGKPWTANELARLRNLARGSTPMRLIVRELGHPEGEVQKKLQELGLTLGMRHFDRLAYLDGRPPT